MSEFYVYKEDDKYSDASQIRVNEPEESYYGVPMKFSKIKETQFNTIMKNIGSNSVIIDFNKNKNINISEQSLYGDLMEQVVSNYPDQNESYFLYQIDDLKDNQYLSDIVKNKYTANNVSLWFAKNKDNSVDCEWFIDPSDWSVRNFSGDNLGKITNIEQY